MCGTCVLRSGARALFNLYFLFAAVSACADIMYVVFKKEKKKRKGVNRRGSDDATRIIHTHKHRGGAAAAKIKDSTPARERRAAFN